MDELKFDEIGYWSEIKLEIVKKYAAAYSTIMARQPDIKRHVYIDAFAGAGVHLSRQTSDFVPGSPMNALLVDPPFREFHFIDLDGGKAGALREMAGDRTDVQVHEGDANSILVEKVFPRCRYEDYHRALCLLDPYGLHLHWAVVQAAGRMGSVEIFLNFPLMDMNRNVLRRNLGKVNPAQAERMTAFWGDSSWRSAAYVKEAGLFGDIDEKQSNEKVIAAYRERLKKVARFKYVPNPMPMKNSTGAIVYYLVFASPSKTGNKIVEDIFARYRERGLR